MKINKSGRLSPLLHRLSGSHLPGQYAMYLCVHCDFPRLTTALNPHLRDFIFYPGDYRTYNNAHFTSLLLPISRLFGAVSNICNENFIHGSGESDDEHGVRALPNECSPARKFMRAS